MNQAHWEKMYTKPLEEIPWEIETMPKEVRGWFSNSECRGQAVLDLGCGTGNYARFLERKGCTVTGIDLSENAIRIAKKKARKGKSKVKFAQANVLTWKPAEKFDFVFEYSVFHHIPAGQRKQYVRQVGNFLREGGKFGLVCYSNQDKSVQGKKVRMGDFGNKIYHPSRKDIEQLFAKDFELVQYQPARLGKRLQHKAHCFLFRKKSKPLDTAVIMAAGKGTRMLPLTKKIPKALVEWKGKPLIAHVLKELQGTQIRTAVIVVGYKGAQVKQALGKKFGKIELQYVWQKKQLGTAHAVQQALPKVNGSFLVLSADVIVHSNDLRKLIQKKIRFL